MGEYLWMKTGLRYDSVKVRVTDTCLSWSTFTSGFQTIVSLKSRQILAAHIEENNKECVHVHYVKVIVINKDQVQVKRDVVTFTGRSKDCSLLAEHIQQLLQTQESHRPKRLLVFVNPGSGAAGNVKSYDATVQPLLNLCGVTAEVVVTTHAYHPVEFLTDYDLDSIDAVVSMGGDGSMGIVAHGLLSKTMSDAGVTLQHDDDRLLKPRVPLTTICGGSDNAMTRALHSSYDVEACTLSVILGQKVPCDVVTAHHDNEWISSFVLISSIGAFSIVLAILEGVRWALKKARYLLMAPLLWWYWCDHSVQIDYLPVVSDVAEPQDDQSSDMTDLNIQDGPKPGWKTIMVKSNVVQLLPWQQRVFLHYRWSSKYHKPDLSRDKMALCIMKSCSYRDFCAKFSSKKDKFQKAMFNTIAVRECIIKGDKSWNPDFLGFGMSCDGEFVPLKMGPEYRTKLHTDRLDLLAIDDVLVSEARLYADV